MFKKLEQWALQRLLKRVAGNIPSIKGKVALIWEDYRDEIERQVAEAIKQAISKVVKKALGKQGIKVLDYSDN